MDENKQYKMARALIDNAGFSILDCLGVAACIQHCLDTCLDNPEFINEYGTKVASAIGNFAKPE